jgi:large subunit ribosomal protein L18
MKRSKSDGPAKTRLVAQSRRHFRARKKISGTAQRPRLAVARSLRHIVAQVIDDTRGHTLVSASTLDPSLRAVNTPVSADDHLTKTDMARKVGALVAERARAAGITTVVFDRGGTQYQGRVAALADAAREAGLEF